MTKKSRTVLFTGGGGAGSEALARLLAPDYSAHFADADPEARPAPIDRAHWHRIPFAAAEDFVAGLRTLCERIGADLLVPCVDEELLPLARARDSFPCPVMLPPVEFIETHLDKLASARALLASGLPTPTTEELTQRAAVDFPCIVKPRRGRGSRGVALVRNEPELHAHLVMSRSSADAFVVQESLGGQEYTVLVAADAAGELRAVVPVRVGIKRGITLRAHTDADAQVIAACRAIHAANPVGGCYNIQLMRSESGVCKPFEINPRISTTTCLALAAGVDFIAAYLGTAPAGPGGALAPFRDHLGLQRSWHNEFIE